MNRALKALTTVGATLALATTLTVAPTAFASPGSVVGPHKAVAAVGWQKATKTTTVRTGKIGIWNVYTTTTYQKFRTSLGGDQWIPIHSTKSYRAG